MSDRIRNELGPKCREMLHEECSQVPILSQRQQIFLVQRVDVRLGVFIDDTVRDDDGSAFVGGPNTIQRETTRKTSDRTEETFKCFRKVMRDVVLIDLNTESSPSE